MRFSKLLFVVVAGCASEPDVTEPLLASDPSVLAFDLAGADHSFQYQIDVRAQTIGGYYVVARGGSSCRASITSSAQLAPAVADHLRDVFSRTFLTTRGEDSCAELLAGCGGPDGDAYVGVTVDGGEYFTQHESCRQLTSAFDLAVQLDTAFDSIVPELEAVEWTGAEWTATGMPCAAADQPISRE
jgi:hypothetical protein